MGQRKSWNNFPWVIIMRTSGLEFLFSAFRSCSVWRAAAMCHPDPDTVKWNKRTREENSRWEVCAFEFPLTNFRVQALNSVNEEGDSVCMRKCIYLGQRTTEVLFLRHYLPCHLYFYPWIHQLASLLSWTRSAGMHQHTWLVFAWILGDRTQVPCLPQALCWLNCPQTEIFFCLLETEFLYIVLAILKLYM